MLATQLKKKTQPKPFNKKITGSKRNKNNSNGGSIQKSADKSLKNNSPESIEKTSASPLGQIQAKALDSPLQLNGLSSPIQAKMNISSPKDPAEEEADQMAAAVIQGKSLPSVQRSPETESEDNTETEKADQAAPDASIGNAIQAAMSGGRPLSDDIRTAMEQRFNADFSQVKIHTGATAVQLSEAVNAKAFTFLNHIFFNAGMYDPKGEAGKELLAHELTHTIQQRAVVQRKAMEDSTSAEPATTDKKPALVIEEPTADNNGTSDNRSTTFANEEGSIDISKTPKVLNIRGLEIPTFKLEFMAPTPIPLDIGGTNREGGHISAWEQVAMDKGVFLNKLYEETGASPGTIIFYMVLRKGKSAKEIKKEISKNKSIPNGTIFGTKDELQKRTSRPYWNAEGKYQPYDVDHKHELQLNGNETDSKNLWLLESKANSASGRLIHQRKDKRIKDLIKAANEGLTNPPNFAEVKNSFQINLVGGFVGEFSLYSSINKIDEGKTWNLEQIKKGDHLNGVVFLTEEEVKSANLKGSVEEIVLYTSRSGGIPNRIPWGKGEKKKEFNPGIPLYRKTGGAKVTIEIVTYDEEGKTGQVGCKVEGGKHIDIVGKERIAFKIAPMDGVEFGGYLPSDSIAQAVQNALTFKWLSPIKMHEASLDDQVGLVGKGTVLPSVPFFKDANIEIVIDQSGVYLRKLLTSDDLNMPTPFSIANSTLEIFLGNNDGLGIEGMIDFGINSVGEGNLKGKASTGGGLSLSGNFNFDAEMFEEAGISVEYVKGVEGDEKWSVSGTLGIGKGKIPGIKSGSLTVAYSEGNFTADGTVQLAISGIDTVNISANYTENSFSLEGDFSLTNNIPGIKSGSGRLMISKNADGEIQVSASGTANPSIPSIDTSLSIAFEDGALSITGSAAYNRGMLSGNANLGVTNRALDGEGNPTGDITKKMIVYGGGNLTLGLTPWLQTTVGVQFKPNGEIEVIGEIGIPGDELALFDRKDYTKNLFQMYPIEIPIFAIPLGPKSIGIVARITGGLDAFAGFGPGVLRELSLKIKYNPDRENETTVIGAAEFAVPADAGISLSGRLGLGVSIALASLTGGIEIMGTLGLEGEAKIGADVNWSPMAGLEINAEGSITVNPKFTFDINAFIEASLDLLLFSVSEIWRKNLTSFEWGPDFQFQILFPVHYKEGEDFDISFDDVKFIYPEIDIQDIAMGLGTHVKDEML